MSLIILIKHISYEIQTVTNNFPPRIPVLSINKEKTRAPHAVPTLACLSWAIILLNYLVKMGHKLKNYSFQSYVPLSCNCNLS